MICRLAAIGLLAALASGCGHAPNPLMAAPPTAPMSAASAGAERHAGSLAAAGLEAGTGVRLRLSIAPPSYRLLAAVSGYTAADVDHVELALYKGGAAVAGATKTIAKADLGAAVTLSNLRAGTSYEVRATAYADAAGATVISNEAASTTSFTTPAVTTTAGVQAIDEVAVPLAIGLTLASRTYAGTLSFAVNPAGQVKSKATHVRITLKAGAATIMQRTETLAAAQAVKSATNLRAGTTYTILAEGIGSGSPEVKYSTDAKSAYTFTTPALANGAEADLNTFLGAATVSVPCVR